MDWTSSDLIYVITWTEIIGIDIAKVIALGSDGAASMTGCKNGVGVQLRQVKPFMIQFHCAAHKLTLVYCPSCW